MTYYVTFYDCPQDVEFANSTCAKVNAESFEEAFKKVKKAGGYLIEYIETTDEDYQQHVKRGECYHMEIL